MKNTLFLTLSLFSISLFAQKGYWQQRVDYQIQVSLDDSKDLLTGTEKLVYTNNSPDDLKELYFHSYWNAFTMGSANLHHQMEIGNMESNKYSKKDEGYIKFTSIKVNGKEYTARVMESITQIKLSEVITPGSNADIEIQFEAKVPACISRSGKNNVAGTDYTMTQWYPKICRYDNQGWHTDPYIGREFAGSFGNFDVTITCSKDYTIAGTGVLQNKTYTTNGWKESTGTGIDANGMTTWHFAADNIHDFAWAADKEFYHQQIVVEGIDFHFFYHNTEDYAQSWSDLIQRWPSAYAVCKEEFGNYPYPRFSFIQAGEGYMEYPMCTMLESGREDFFSTACHEFMHNYFYGMFGTDENLHHWMDEGLTSYAEARLTNGVNGVTSNPALEAASYYKWVRALYPEDPIATSANYYKHDYAYYNGAYYKGQLFPELIRYIIGDSLMHQGFARYYQNWQFKHPEPNDFVKTFEDVSSMELTWFQNYWLNTTKVIDYSIDSVNFKGSDMQIVFTNRGGVPMPIEFSVDMKDGSQAYHYIPIDLTNNPKSNFLHPTTVHPYWSFAVSKYRMVIKGVKKKDVLSITIDPDNFLPDVKPGDNIFQP